MADLLEHVEGGVATLTLNRPDSLNALSDPMITALLEALDRLGRDPTVGAIVLAAAGRAFCAGGDVKGMGGKPGSSNAPELTFDQKVARLQERQRTLTGALVNVRKPTIAALPGPAAGAGLSLALACDLRIAAQSAFVTTAYVKIGLSGDYGMAWLLTRLVGTSRARELMFFGEKIDAKRCEALGIVNRVVPDDKLREEAFAWAKKLAEGPTTALRFLKDNLDEALMNDFLTSLDHEAERMVRSAGTADHKEAVKAFVEKRKPVFAKG